MEQLFKSIEKRLKPTKEEIKTIGVVRSGYIADNGKRPKNTPDTLEICPRIRVLIIGKANTGKLTILQKMCGTTDTPTVIDRNGREIDPSILEDLTFMRGMHDIENELFFPSNPRLRFHDSRGFEGGSTEEIDKVRSFIADRANRIELKDRLHIIWYCVPMDQKRVLRKAELTFFENGTGDVPVIVLFTKWDGQIVHAFSDLKQQGRSLQEAHREAPQYAMGIFKKYYLPMINSVAHPPAAYLLLGSMDKEEATCSELAIKTITIVNNAILSMMESSNYLDLSGKIQKREQSNFGGFSDIWRGTLRKHGADIEVAIKELRVRQSASSENAAAITERLKKRCFREVLLWRTLQHVNIVPLLGFAMDPSGNPVLISPWCPNGNVVHFLNSYPDANRPALALDAAEGLTYLHSIPVVHGDLKAENVLVDNSGRACLCDFGMSQFIDESARITGFTTTHANAGGTDRFLSPELLSDNPKTTTSDIWAFGCVVVQILTGQIPFEWITQKYAVIPAIMRGERPIKGRDGRVDQELWDCLEKCWTMDPEDRPEASSLQRELSQHKQRCL